MDKNVLVIGASSQIALETIKLMLDGAYKVFATSRGEIELCNANLFKYSLDVSNKDDFFKLKSEICNLNLDAIIYAAGIAISSPVEFLDENELLRQLDVNLFGLLRTLKHFSPLLKNKDAKIIILTSHNDEKEVLNSLKAGANAYCSKEINLERLVQVVQSVADGAAWFDPSIAHVVLQAGANSQSSEMSSKYKDYDLTAREAQILKLMTEGHSNMEIAQKLVISVNTTKAHVASILQKLEVDDRLQAALKALKYKIV